MRRTVGKYTLGIVLIAVGLMVVLETAGVAPFPRDAFLTWWPLTIVFLGLEYTLASRDPEVRVRISGGAVFLTVLALGFAWAYQAYGWTDLINIQYPGNFIAGPTEAYIYEIPIDEAFGTGVTGLSVSATGGVIVTGTATRSVTGTATVTVRAKSLDEAKQYAGEVKLVPRYSGKTLYLEVHRPGSLAGKASVHSSFVLTVPEDSDLKLSSVSGSVEVQGVRGRLELDCVSADIRLDDSPSRVEVTSVSGDFEGVLGSEMEELSIETVSGDVSIEVPEGTGGSVKAVTVSGSITSPGDVIKASRSGGRRKAEGSVGSGKTAIEIETVSGDVTFR